MRAEKKRMGERGGELVNQKVFQNYRMTITRVVSLNEGADILYSDLWDPRTCVAEIGISVILQIIYSWTAGGGKFWCFFRVWDGFKRVFTRKITKLSTGISFFRLRRAKLYLYFSAPAAGFQAANVVGKVSNTQSQLNINFHVPSASQSLPQN